jgi:hypothetical protein
MLCVPKKSGTTMGPTSLPRTPSSTWFRTQWKFIDSASLSSTNPRKNRVGWSQSSDISGDELGALLKFVAFQAVRTLGHRNFDHDSLPVN